MTPNQSDIRPSVRELPNDPDAEASCVEAVMLHVEQRDELLTILRQEHFRSEPNGWIFEAVRDLHANNKGIDFASVTGWLRDRDKLAVVGGVAYLVQVANLTPASAYAAQHAQTVLAKWKLRQYIAKSQNRTAEAYYFAGEVQAFLDKAEQEVYELARTEATQTGVPVSAVLKDVFAALSAAAERGDRLTGISTGYERLDAKTSGLHDGDLTIVAGRPSMGKTAFGMNLAVNIATPPENPTHPVYGVEVFSLEMPREQLVARMVCSEARVDLERMRSGNLQPEDWRRLTEAAGFLSTLPLWIDDSPSLSILDLRAKVRRRQAQYNSRAKEGRPERRVGSILIDYLQLMKGREGVHGREQEIGEISRGLKALAKELRVPVIALAQLNRSVETRSTKDKRPQMSDLRESGSIEADADNIILLYRDEYYQVNSDMKGIAELILAKQRNGPTGKVLTRFSASCTRFDNLAAGDYPEVEE